MGEKQKVSRWEAIGDSHSIVEVVFTLEFARPFDVEELAAFYNGGKHWKEFLPIVTLEARAEGAKEFSVAPDAIPQLEFSETPVLSKVLFQRVKADASPEWRLQATTNLVTVNCLNYLRWASVSTKARELHMAAISSLFESTAATQGEQNVLELQSLTLQYIDRFSWTGSEDDYQLNLLINPNSDRVPAAILPRKIHWHSHQGWYETAESPSKGRILDRLHMSGQIVNNSYIATLDTVCRFEFEEHLKLGQTDFLDIFQSLVEVWDLLHEKSKSVLSDVLQENIQGEISLNA